MEFKGTKGKWLVKHSKSKDAWNVLGTILGSRYKIARCPYLQNSNLSKEWNEVEKLEQEANAKLIAYAPEMLEMLSKVLTGIHQMSFDQLELMVVEIEDLIKKATEL